MKPATVKVGTREVMAALRKKYSGQYDAAWSGGFYLEECGINGQGAQSRCDALYAGFTAASGRTLIGHEVKVSRSDWLTELKKVGKADFWFDNTHQWYLVTPPDVVEDAELPHQWGHMVLRGSQLRIYKQAPVRDVTPSWLAVRSMMSRAETLRAESVRNAVQEAREVVREQLRDLERQLFEAQALAGARGPGGQKLARVIAEVDKRLAERQVYDRLDEAATVELIVGTVVDWRVTHEAHRQLMQSLQALIGDINRVAGGVRSSYGALGEILKSMEERDGTQATV